MNPLSYIAGVSIAALLGSGILVSPVDAAVSPFAHPPSSYLIQVNGRTFRERNPNLRRAPASLTKIMTALIVMEHCPMDQVVTVSSGASRETGSRIGLRRGDRLTVRDLLAATLIASANDAARALADHLGGNQKAFVKRMNERARELQLHNTSFTNACGHDHAGLYSSASDLAILSDRALRIPLFADLVSRRAMRIATLKSKRTFGLKNKNRLIGRYPGASGVKTGTTPNAGQCLVALAERGNTKVLLVMMQGKNRWWTAPAMLDAAFAANSTAKKSLARSQQ
jgi:D-alanyl-D-alanine carboxypeptidase (penicillin-binding protein 5/6)